MKTFEKSSKLDNVLYDVRGPAVDEAARMEEDGMEILKLNIGNPYPFGFSAPQEVILDMLSNIRTSSGIFRFQRNTLPQERPLCSMPSFEEFPGLP